MLDDKVKYNYERLKEISIILDLDFETQDWGIINSNGSRVEEFIAV